MIKETSGDSYEKARSINQQLTFEKASDFFKKRKVQFGKVQMKSLHLIGEDNTYTNLAFLLSEQCTHTIKLAVFEGSKKTVFRDRKELSGSILEQLEEAVDYIDRYNRTRAEFSGLDRIDIRDYPTEAIREALLNAVVHRDYSFSESTLVSIFEDRIEFVTIGGLVRGITLDDVKLGVSVLRNQYLANVFYRLKLIEAYGTGILKINECYEDYKVKPVIETTNNAFKITLPNINFYTEEQEKQIVFKTGNSLNTNRKRKQMNEVLELCRTNGFVIRKDVEKALGISQATSIVLLRDMVKADILVKEGKSKNLRYYEKR